jgi:hypothetical protein
MGRMREKPSPQPHGLRSAHCIMLVPLTVALTACSIISASYLAEGLSIEPGRLVVLANNYNDTSQIVHELHPGQVTIMPFQTLIDLRSLVLAVGVGGLVICMYLCFHLYQLFYLLIRGDSLDPSCAFIE